MKEMLSESLGSRLKQVNSCKHVWKAVEDSTIRSVYYTKLYQCSFSSVRQGDALVSGNILTLRETYRHVKCSTIYF